MPRQAYQQRCQMLYFRSKNEHDSWSKAAKDAGASTSRYILEMADLGKGKRDPPMDTKEAAQLRQEVARLREQNESLQVLRERNESEIMKLRHRVFLEPDHDGKYDYSKRIIDILKSGGIWPGHELLKALHISLEDYVAVNIVIAQLRSLEAYGLVRENIGGWQWI
jgi:hypothetical protein